MNSEQSPVPYPNSIQDYPSEFSNGFRMDYNQNYQYNPLQMNYLDHQHSQNSHNNNHHHHHHPSQNHHNGQSEHLMSLSTPQDERTMFEFQFQNMHDVIPQDMINLVPNPSPPFSPNFPSYFESQNNNMHFIATQPVGLSLNVSTNETSPQISAPSGPSFNRLLSLPDISIMDNIQPSSSEVNSDKKSTVLIKPKNKPRVRRASSRPDILNKSELNLESDAKGEPRQYECSVAGCTKVFKRSEHLKRHVRSIHSSEKPFPCPTCGKHFSRSDNLNQHLRIHARPKTKISTIRARPTPYSMELDHFLPFMSNYYPNDPSSLQHFNSNYPNLVAEDPNFSSFAPYLPSPSQS